MTERPPQQSEPSSSTWHRREVLSSLVGAAALLLIRPAEGRGAEPPADGEVAELTNRFFMLRRTHLNFQPLRKRNDSLEHQAARLVSLAAPLFKLDTTDKERDGINRQLSAAFESRSGGQTRASFSYEELLNQFHTFTKQCAEAGYFFEFMPKIVAQAPSSGPVALRSVSFTPVNLRVITKVERQTASHCWDNQPLTYDAVTLGQAVLSDAGQPLVPVRERLSDREAGLSAEYDAMIIDSLIQAPAVRVGELRSFQEKLSADSQLAMIRGLTLADVLQNLKDSEPDVRPGLAAERYMAMMADRIAAMDPEQQIALERKVDRLHEVSHLFFERLALARHRRHFKASGTPFDAQNFQSMLDNRAVEAEIGAFLGSLIYGMDELPKDRRWYPLYLLAEGAHKKQTDRTHGLACEWILREFVARVYLRPTDFGLDLGRISEADRELAVWAQLAEIADRAPKAALQAAWEDIALSYRRSLDHSFVKLDGRVQTRPIESPAYTPGAPAVHPSWGGVAVTLAVGGAAWLVNWRKQRMAAQREQPAWSKGKRKQRKK